MRSWRQDQHFWERLLLFLQSLVLQQLHAEHRYNLFMPGHRDLALDLLSAAS